HATGHPGRRTMGWDVIAGTRDGSNMGSVERIRSAIQKHLTEVRWHKASEGIFLGEGFSCEVWLGFDLQDEDPVSCVIFSLRGGGAPLPALTALARAERWSLVDASSSEELDLDSPSRENWEGYQELAAAAAEDMRRRESRKKRRRR